MTNPLRFSIGNHADQAALGGNPGLDSLPLANLKDEDIQKIWRSASPTTTQAIIADLAASKTVGVVSLINLRNTLSPVTFHVRVSTSDPTGIDGDAYTIFDIPSMVDPVYNTFVHFIEPAVTGRYVRISMNFLTASAEAGRLVISDTWLPSRDVSLVRPPEEIPIDHTQVSYSLGGNRFQDIRQRQRRYRFVLRGLQTAEKDTYITELNRTRGIGREILICWNKDSTNLARDTVWGHLTQLVQCRRMADVVDGWEAELEIEERI